jgi:hypothetical protein
MLLLLLWTWGWGLLGRIEDQSPKAARKEPMSEVTILAMLAKVSRGKMLVPPLIQLPTTSSATW